MILLWGLPEDGTLTRVRDAVRRLRQPSVFLDQRRALEMEVELRVDTAVRGFVHDGDQTVDLTSVGAAYFRADDVSCLPSIQRAGLESATVRRALASEAALWSWAEVTPALVVNRPSAMGSNNSKPYQTERIRPFGFRIPETLLTTDPAAARAFWGRHGAVVYKSISGVRSIVSRLCPENAARLEDVRWCPTQFQEYVPGHDYRVHVVRDRVFACEIVSGADDYRYAARQGFDVSMCGCDLPRDVADRCRLLARGLGLDVAGIDLRLTPAGDWYCFEVNPSPAFAYFQEESGLPIDAAVAQLLAEGDGQWQTARQQHESS